MTYLVVGVDRRTFAPWHENVSADDAVAAGDAAVARAGRRGIDLVIAAVIGPGSSVVSILVDERATPPRAA
jgi:hypothetical protein